MSDAFKEAQSEADFATRQDLREMEQRIIKMGALMALSIGIVAALVKLL